MQEYPKKILIIAIAIVMMWIPITTLAQETHLRWKNGDALSGKLLDSESGKIRWASPYFSDDLIVDINVLDSIVFSKQTAPATETFRVGTVSGDVWIADIIDSDENTLLFSSKRHGKFRMNREVIYSLESRAHSNLIFDGSQLTAWKSSKEDAAEAVENQHTGWYADHGGHPHTDQKKANIFYAIEWPKRFEIDLELASTIPNPGFVLALGKNLYETLRLETWIHELVVVQGTLFESIMAIGPDRRNFRLRLAYDQELGMLKVFDLNGNLLLELENVQPTLTSPGLYIYNRGQNLTVRRLKVYRQSAELKNQQVDYSKPRVHMMDGKVFYGKLFVKKDKSYVLDTDGVQWDINLQQIDRVVQPGKALTTINEDMMTLTYTDGSIIRGQVMQLNPDSVLLQTAFADQPITCSLADASMLRFEPKAKIKERGQDYDKMYFPSRSLRGHVIFDSKDTSNIQWKPAGTSEPVSLANNRSVRIERNNKHVSRLRPFDVEMFPHLLHLKNGEVIPCKVLAYDEASISLRSPFISATRIDSAHIKGIEFARGKTQTRKENRNPITITGGDKHRIILEDGRKLDAVMQRAEDGTLKIIVNNRKPGEDPKVIILGGDFAADDVAALQHGVKVIFDPLETQAEELDVKLERALTVPRFNRDNPPNHILVANNGDLRRGKFLSFNGGIILFESKLKKIPIPIDRVARIVDISVEDSDESAKEGVGNQQSAIGENGAEVRFALIHNPILIFEPLEVKGDKLYGRSPIYGEVSIPVKSVQYLHFGDKAKSFKSVFEKWVAQPAKEPDYGKEPDYVGDR